MSYFLKKALKITVNYLIVLLIFIVFLYTFIAIAGDSFSRWLPLYSILNFIVLFFLIYSEYKQLAKKEKKPQYGLPSYPLKGLLLGLVGFLPIVAVFVILSNIDAKDELAARLIEIAIDGLLGPVYFIVRFGGGTVAAYAAAVLVIPIIAALGYLAGYYGFSFRNIFGRKKETPDEARVHNPSPWNPSVVNKEKKKKNKRYGN